MNLNSHGHGVYNVDKNAYIVPTGKFMNELDCVYVACAFVVIRTYVWTDTHTHITHTCAVCLAAGFDRRLSSHRIFVAGSVE